MKKLKPPAWSLTALNDFPNDSISFHRRYENRCQSVGRLDDPRIGEALNGLHSSPLLRKNWYHNLTLRHHHGNRPYRDVSICPRLWMGFTNATETSFFPGGWKNSVWRVIWTMPNTYSSPPSSCCRRVTTIITPPAGDRTAKNCRCTGP